VFTFLFDCDFQIATKEDEVLHKDMQRQDMLSADRLREVESSFAFLVWLGPTRVCL
jgi:hypothetical protein